MGIHQSLQPQGPPPHNNHLLICGSCLPYTRLCIWLYLEFVDICHLQCQQIYAGTYHTLPRWKEVHAVLMIAHPETENIHRCTPSPPTCVQNENALLCFSIRSFWQESLQCSQKEFHGKIALTHWCLNDTCWKVRGIRMLRTWWEKSTKACATLEVGGFSWWTNTC